MKVKGYFILECVALIGAVIALLADSTEYAAIMFAFVALFGLRRLEAELEEDE